MISTTPHFNRSETLLRWALKPRRLTVTAAVALILALALPALSVTPSPVFAASIVVTTSADDTDAADNRCSLREAIDNANDNAVTHGNCAGGNGADTITFQAGITTIVLADSLPWIIANSGELTIDGGGLVTVSGDDAHTPFVVNLNASLHLRGLTVANGFAPNTFGGAIGNGGTLTLTNSTVRDSTARNGSGGGIYSDGTLAITNSTISGNTGGFSGGGIYSAGAATITNSTISGNTAATGSGGGIFSSTANATITNSTISGNRAALSGGGIFISIANATITNSTISANTATSPGGGIRSIGTLAMRNTIIAGQLSGADCELGGNFDVGGTNLASDGTCGASSVQPGAGAFLGGLANNGGPTFTHALLSGSAAINAGNYAFCAANVGSPTFGAVGKDQRGVTRPQPAGGACDIGAYELCMIGNAADTDCDGVANTKDTCANTPAVARPVSTSGCSEQQLGLVRPAQCLQGAAAYSLLIVGGAGNDNLVGPNGSNNLIYGQGGNDNISDGSGSSCLIGGAGNDNLVGGAGLDVLVGGAGNDKGVGGAGFDRCGLDVEVRTECEATF